MKIGRKWVYLDSGMRISRSSLRICPSCKKETAYEYAGLISCDDCGYRDNIFERVKL